MKAKYDLTNAAALVEEYVREIQRPDIVPARVGARSWLELAMERHGIVPQYRDGFGFGESHAIWYACRRTTGAASGKSGRIEAAAVMIRSAVRFRSC